VSSADPRLTQTVSAASASTDLLTHLPPDPTAVLLSTSAAINDPTVLETGEITVIGRMPNSSNATFLVMIAPGEVDLTDRPVDDRNIPTPGPNESLGIYKPAKGERPLWDFSGELWKREVAAFELSTWLGWDVIPATVERDGPFGVGSVQRFVEADFEEHYFTLYEHEKHHPNLLMMGAFDVLANNADRKGGHCLIASDGRIWGIDNGLCFHEEPKLRTVIWEFAGEPIPDDLQPSLNRLAATDPCDSAAFGRLAELLDESERAALVQRAKVLQRRHTMPQPRSERAYPWPLV
jgi:uncharacterized repeat protein (TIGR03843 family)